MTASFLIDVSLGTIFKSLPSLDWFSGKSMTASFLIDVSLGTIFKSSPSLDLGGILGFFSKEAAPASHIFVSSAVYGPLSTVVQLKNFFHSRHPPVLNPHSLNRRCDLLNLAHAAQMCHKGKCA